MSHVAHQPPETLREVRTCSAASLEEPHQTRVEPEVEVADGVPIAAPGGIEDRGEPVVDRTRHLGAQHLLGPSARGSRC